MHVWGSEREPKGTRNHPFNYFLANIAGQRTQHTAQRGHACSLIVTNVALKAD